MEVDLAEGLLFPCAFLGAVRSTFSGFLGLVPGLFNALPGAMKCLLHAVAGGYGCAFSHMSGSSGCLLRCMFDSFDVLLSAPSWLAQRGCEIAKTGVITSVATRPMVESALAVFIVKENGFIG